MTLRRDDPNVKVICGSCRAGEHVCGGDCDCPCPAARAARAEQQPMPVPPARPLTPGQRKVLEIVSEHGEVETSARTDPSQPWVSGASAAALEHRGLLTGRLIDGHWRVRLTDDGRAAVAKGGG